MNTRDKIIEVAGNIFVEQGYDGTSVRDIIKAAGANLGAVTYYFGSKRDLFTEVLYRKTQPLRDIGTQIAKSRKNPEQKLREMMEVFAMHVLNKHPDLKVFFAEILAGGERLPAKMIESIKLRNKIFMDTMQSGVSGKLFRKCDTECAAWCFFGMLSSYILFQPLIMKGGRRGAYSSAEVKKIVNTAFGIYMNGIRCKK